MKSIRLSPILVAVLNLAAAVLYYVFPTHIPLNWELSKQQEFILAGTAVGVAFVSLVLYFIATRKVLFRTRFWQQRVGHLFALFAQSFVFGENLSKFIKAFKYDFVPVMPSNTVGVWMLVLSGLLIIGAVLHPRKTILTETEA